MLYRRPSSRALALFPSLSQPAGRVTVRGSARLLQSSPSHAARLSVRFVMDFPGSATGSAPPQLPVCFLPTQTEIAGFVTDLSFPVEGSSRKGVGKANLRPQRETLTLRF